MGFWRIEYNYFDYRPDDRMKLLRKDERLLLRTGKMPLSHGLVQCDLELKEVTRGEQRHYVASVNFPSYRALSLELPKKGLNEAYESLKDRLENGKYKLLVNLDGLLGIQFKKPASNIKSILRSLDSKKKK